MKSTPLLFSAPMVLALLAGRKTQTRRPVKGVEECPHGYDVVKSVDGPTIMLASGATVTCPYGVHGDLIWVRETLRTHGHFGFPLDKAPQIRKEDKARVWSYAADGVKDWTGSRPSIHMPRWACRIELELTDVNVERVQDISRKDAIAEGLIRTRRGWCSDEGNAVSQDPRECYADLWHMLNDKRGYGWRANPWVWVLTFKRVHR